MSSVQGQGCAGSWSPSTSATQVPGTKNWAPTASPTDSPFKLSKQSRQVVMSTAILPLRRPGRVPDGQFEITDVRSVTDDGSDRADPRPDLPDW
ncbi:hypothetical protein Raf01_00920 [Rugosimonospora africana]|uniref:Uncharacterized protein n=1 Tax=Rugosimonospora africana TaxID=556532 RepID=A0A8J3VMF4_9ACTN|nr:hypothetical protein Raf01_00920 [Rugosimonospora africana]